MKGYSTRPELEQGKGGTIPVEFGQDRNFLASTANRFCDSLIEQCTASGFRTDEPRGLVAMGLTCRSPLTAIRALKRPIGS